MYKIIFLQIAYLFFMKNKAVGKIKWSNIYDKRLV